MRRSRIVLLVVAVFLVGVVLTAWMFWRSQYSPGSLNSEADRLAGILEIRPGMTVADIGAGDGRIAARLAATLGPSGRVFATEIDPVKLDVLRRTAASNMRVVEAAEHSTGLDDRCCDAIYMRRVYHHLTDPAAINQALFAALRPGGRLGVIDMLSPNWLIFVHHGIPADTVIQQVTAAGFTLDRRIRWVTPIDYLLVFRRPVTRVPGP